MQGWHDATQLILQILRDPGLWCLVSGHQSQLNNYCLKHWAVDT